LIFLGQDGIGAVYTFEEVLDVVFTQHLLRVYIQKGIGREILIVGIPNSDILILISILVQFLKE
jgi:hypothetical protein